ncbi:hypothetical protein SOP93_17030 [Peribacillus frigoritolerans]|uniref:hypothetical protein n=1 Tax=Peribacillus frigoritolerans TaxID=450367 RepID=UPI002B24C05A|nr:hypothetical protein [Peribacillus frigoritolerans]MEB2492870.1 hypothetical protein [Peribacillus frigoritolerans]
MLLGYEFDLLSSIASSYHSHSSGVIQFDKTSYLSNFQSEDPNLEYLGKLEIEGLLTISKNNLITINIHVWAEFFTERLQKVFSLMGYDLKCNYDREGSKLFVSKSKEEKIEFVITCKNEIPQDEINFISLCYINTSQEYYLHWLELLNDYNNLELLYAFINEEVNRLNYKSRLIFNFFEGLDKGDLNEIFYSSIKNYLIDEGFNVKDFSTMQQFLKKITKTELDNLYIMEKNGDRLLLLKNNEKIEFSLIRNEQEIYIISDEILSIIKQMEEKLLIKINEYRKITRLNQFKLFDNTRKTAQYLSLLLVPLNGIMLLGNSLNIPFLNTVTQNVYFYWVSIAVFVFVFGFSLFYIVKPIYHLSKFSWKL